MMTFAGMHAIFVLWSQDHQMNWLIPRSEKQGSRHYISWLKDISIVPSNDVTSSLYQPLVIWCHPTNLRKTGPEARRLEEHQKKGQTCYRNSRHSWLFLEHLCNGSLVPQWLRQAVPPPPPGSKSRAVATRADSSDEKNVLTCNTMYLLVLPWLWRIPR